MADEPAPIELGEVVVEAPRLQSTGRRDHDIDYEQKPPTPPPQAPANGPALPDDTVYLEVAGHRFTGWQDVRIVRGMEVFPSHFVLRLTERVPDRPTLLAISPGQTFRLRLGKDLVMSGYIDTYQSQISSKGHEVMVVGRSGTEDLIDSAAGVSEGKESEARMTFSASSLLTLSNDLCAPFGIKVTAPEGEGTPIVSVGDGIPQFTIALGQCVYEVLEPIARWKQRVLLDGVDGNLVIAKVGTVKAASGFTLPGSVIAASVRFSKQDRYTVYLPALQAFDSAYDVSAASGQASTNYFAPILDEAAFKDQPRLDGKPRYRPRFVLSEQPFGGLFLAERRADWQKGRDYGRSQAVSATVPLWRDRAGTLWAPNTLAPVHMPALKLPNLNWLISQVVYLKGFGGGTRTVATLMPPEAFETEPSLFTPFDPQIAQAMGDALSVNKNGGAGPSSAAGQG